MHCAIGSARDPNIHDYGGGDYVVTSTLASQCPPAVGRGLAFPIADTILRGNKSDSPKQVSFVTIGDGSVHNAHFLASFKHAMLNNKISQNDLIRFERSCKGRLKNEVAPSSKFSDEEFSTHKIISYWGLKSQPTLNLMKNLCFLISCIR